MAINAITTLQAGNVDGQWMLKDGEWRVLSDEEKRMADEAYAGMIKAYESINQG